MTRQFSENSPPYSSVGEQERTRAFLFSQSLGRGTIARHFQRIYQVVIVDQRALAFHLVGQERSCGVFACAGKGVNPDESAGRLGLGGRQAGS